MSNNKCNKQTQEKTATRVFTNITEKVKLEASNYNHPENVQFLIFGDATKRDDRHKHRKNTYKAPNMGTLVILTPEQVRHIKEYLGLEENVFATPTNSSSSSTSVSPSTSQSSISSNSSNVASAGAYVPFMQITTSPDDHRFDKVGQSTPPDAPYYTIQAGGQTRYVYCGDAYPDHCSFSANQSDDEYYPDCR